MNELFEQNILKLKNDFAKCQDWEERFQKLINLAQTLPTYPMEHRLENFKVKGCQSQVWLHPEPREGRFYFSVDSDAILVKGIVALLWHAYNGASVGDILAEKGEFLTDLGIRQHLSMNRTNGLASMLKQIQLYCIVLAKSQP
jgi:cysteine desulfuration protein SufE